MEGKACEFPSVESPPSPFNNAAVSSNLFRLDSFFSGADVAGAGVTIGTI